MIGPRVTLKEHDLRLCALTAFERQNAAIKKGRTEFIGENDFTDGMSVNFRGVCAEYAVGMWLDRHHPTAIGSIKTPDVGWRYPAEVRHTPYSIGSLLLYPKDHPEAPFVLAVGSPPSFVLAGWIWGHEAKVASRWREELRGKRLSEPAFVVDQADLRPIEGLLV